ncbi:ATP-dependent endopeptidase Lon [Borrelia parkeri SLO]|uniref:ATP-dependent endopeptidase Lon n=1 Tax=Borrelia parkeri SLO TaxID=1313294 RepID=A0ABN4CC57_BORPR|nr:ATP-dependent endopeptidase Lon [Borrelia parkeri SLO]
MLISLGQKNFMKSILNLISSKKDDLPVIVLRQNVFFPNVTLWVNFDDSVSINAIYQSMLEGRLILFFCVNDLNSDNSSEISLENLYSIGLYAKIIQVVKVTEILIKILVTFQDRVIIKSILKKIITLEQKLILYLINVNLMMSFLLILNS